jgi:hypothetical protein
MTDDPTWTPRHRLSPVEIAAALLVALGIACFIILLRFWLA